MFKVLELSLARSEEMLGCGLLGGISTQADTMNIEHI